MSILAALRNRSAGAAGLCLGLGLLSAVFSLVLGPAGPAAAAECSNDPGPGVDWSKCAKKMIMLQGNDFKGAVLVEADFTLTDLSKTNLDGANLEEAVMARAWLTGATAKKANFSRVEGYRTGFDKVTATGATFAAAELQRASFKDAVLTNAVFDKAELGRADFSGAELTGARFRYTNLSRADLSKAKFEGGLDFSRAFLFLTRVEGLDLSTSTGLEQEQVDLACGNAETKLPPGFTAPSSWPCPFD